MNKKKNNERAPVPRRFKPYPAYKGSGIDWLGEIPAHWTPLPSRRLIGRIEQGWSPVAEDRQAEPDEWAVIKIGAVKSGKFVPAEHKALPPDLIPDTRYEIREGDFLLTRANTPDLVGDVCVVRGVRPKLMLCDLVYRLQLRDQRLEPFFFAYWLGSRVGRHQIEVDARGASLSMVKVSQGHIRAWMVALPPAEEQRSIAAFLDRETARIDALVAKKERLIELLQEKRTALITRAITKGLDRNSQQTLTGTGFFQEAPASWTLQKLRRLIRQVKRPVAVVPEEEYQEIGIRSWGKGIFHKDPVSGAFLDEKSIFRIAPGDFVLNIVFAWEGAVGVASERERGLVASHRFPTFRPSEEVDLDYLLLFLQSEQGRALMAINSPGAAGRNRTIRLGQFLDEEVTLPPLTAQRKIGRAFRLEEKRLQSLTEKVQQAIDRLKELRTALISAAVTGKIDVREEVA